MTGLVVPVTMVVTFIAMKILGQSFNLMTLGGLAAAVGLVIDDKIVVVENIVLHRDGGEGPLEATASALKELTVPLIGSTLTPIVVFLPLITITGVTGTFFRSLAIAMSVALLTSLVTRAGVDEQPERASGSPPPVSRRAAWDARRSASQHPSRIGRQRRARRAGATHDDRRRRVVCARRVQSIASDLRARPAPRRQASGRRRRHVCRVGRRVISVLRRIGRDLLPAFDEGGFVLDYVMPPGSSLQETSRVVGHLESILRDTPEVESTSRRTGLELGLAAVTEPNTGDIAVKLKATRSRGVDDVIRDVRAKVASSEPGLDVEFIQVLQDMIGDLTGAPRAGRRQVVLAGCRSPDDLGAAGGGRAW